MLYITGKNFFLLLSSCVTTFLALYVYHYINLNEVQCIAEPNMSYTYIIVGAGTSGCVLAARLSENVRHTVLLIEAGSQFNAFSKVPLLATLLQKSAYDWSYESESQKWSSAGFSNRKQFLPRGKGLGGSAQMNFMIHQSAMSKQGLDAWESKGAYSLKMGVLKYLEINVRSPRGNMCNYMEYLFFNTRNTCQTRYNAKLYQEHLQKSDSPLSRILQTATKKLPKNNKVRYDPCLSTIFEGQRWSVYNKYLLPIVKRRNLHILCNTEVTQIIFEKRKAIAVRAMDSNQNWRTILSDLEIIISAGSINTPKLLMQSGIGNRIVLEKLNIPVIVDKPGVGLNLHDHLIMPLYVSLNEPISLTISKLFNFKEIYNYLFYKKGLLASSPIAGIVKMGRNVSITLFGMGSTNEKIFRTVSNYLPKTFQNIFPYYNDISQEGVVFLASCTDPKSRGFIQIRNRDPFFPLLIDPQYLKAKDDIICMKEAIELTVRVANSKTFKAIGATIHWPQFEECKAFGVNETNPKYIKCIIRTAAMTAYHQAGSCKMGSRTDPLSVVDNNFKIKELVGLRIIDASILPTPLATFPNSVLVAIAEYAADQIIERKRY